MLRPDLAETANRAETERLAEQRQDTTFLFNWANLISSNLNSNYLGFMVSDLIYIYVVKRKKCIRL